MKRLCVFCGSSLGRRPAYQQAAGQLGRVLADSQIELIYGGGNCGLMGILADAALSRGGGVIGIIPNDLVAKEVGHTRLTELRVVATMHERKALMSKLADAFLALPGGFGTFEELFEVITWTQLGLQNKAIGLLNVEGYFDPLLQLMDHAVAEGFVRQEHRALLVASDSPQGLVASLSRSAPKISVDKWIDSATSGTLSGFEERAPEWELRESGE